MSFEKFIDVIGVNENYLICIFMNFNQNVENRVKQGGKLSPLQVLMGYMINLVSLKPILLAASVIRGAAIMP